MSCLRVRISRGVRRTSSMQIPPTRPSGFGFSVVRIRLRRTPRRRIYEFGWVRPTCIEGLRNVWPDLPSYILISGSRVGAGRVYLRNIIAVIDPRSRELSMSLRMGLL